MRERGLTEVSYNGAGDHPPCHPLAIRGGGGGGDVSPHYWYIERAGEPAVEPRRSLKHHSAGCHGSVS